MKGSPAYPWTEDLAILKDEDPTQDSGAIANLLPIAIEKYKARTPQICHLTSVRFFYPDAL